MSRQISEADVAFDASNVLADHFQGLMFLEDGRPYKVDQIDRDGNDLIVAVEGTKHLKIEPAEFRIRFTVERNE